MADSDEFPDLYTLLLDSFPDKKLDLYTSFRPLEQEFLKKDKSLLSEQILDSEEYFNNSKIIQQEYLISDKNNFIKEFSPLISLDSILLESNIKKKSLNEFVPNSYQLLSPKIHKEDSFIEQIIDKSNMLSNYNHKFDPKIPLKREFESNFDQNESLVELVSGLMKQGFAPKLPSSVSCPDVPDQYSDLVAKLSESYPGIEFSESISLSDQSQHNVDILTFRYVVNGQSQYLHIVVKDNVESEEVVLGFLSDLGIETHSVVDSHDRLFLEHVGSQDLREIVRSGSEHEMVHACDLALGKIAQIHTLASENIELLENRGFVLPTANYVSLFQNRFLLPASDNSSVVSLQMQRLMQVYSSFVSSFVPNSFAHGDFHTANCRVSDDQCFVIDYEWANFGRRFDDLARFTNSVLRERKDIDRGEASRYMFRQYVDAHNSQDAPAILPTDSLYGSFEMSLINDELYKVGEYISFAHSHPLVAEEKLEKSKACFVNVLNMLDNHPGLDPLKSALLDFASVSPYLKEAAIEYHRPVLRLVA